MVNLTSHWHVYYTNARVSLYLYCIMYHVHLGVAGWPVSLVGGYQNVPGVFLSHPRPLESLDRL